MFKIRHKGVCKRKAFLGALKIGMFVYLEFLDDKSLKHIFGDREPRSLIPRKRIFKVISKNKLELIYIMNPDGDWVSPQIFFDEDFNLENMYTYNKIRKKYRYNIYSIWSRLQLDTVRNIKIMSNDELVAEFFTELI